MNIARIQVIAASLALLLSGQSLFAASFSQDRFTALLETVKSGLQKVVEQDPDLFTKTPEDQANALVMTKLRDQAFQVEGLAGVYDTYPNADVQQLVLEIQTTSKALEDFIGNYDKYEGGRFPDKLAAAALALSKGVFGLADGPAEQNVFIRPDGSSPRLQALIDRVASANWLNENEDRAYVLARMSQMLTTVASTPYDMGRLEAGLHELRRQMRWFPISSVALGGLLQVTNDGVCNYEVNFPSPAVRFVIKDTGITQKACVVSKCLYDDIDADVSYLGQLKDSVEGDVIAAGNDITPDSAKVPAQAFYDKLHSLKTMENLAAEINKCLVTEPEPTPQLEPQQ